MITNPGIIILGRLPSSIESTEGRMAAIKDAINHTAGELSGFTLFAVKGGWQMSIRPANEPGWIVQLIPDAMAQRILLALERDERFTDEAGRTIKNMVATEQRQQGLQAMRDMVLADRAGSSRIDALIVESKAAVEACTAALRAWGG